MEQGESTARVSSCLHLLGWGKVAFLKKIRGCDIIPRSDVTSMFEIMEQFF